MFYFMFNLLIFINVLIFFNIPFSIFSVYVTYVVSAQSGHFLIVMNDCLSLEIELYTIIYK